MNGAEGKRPPGYSGKDKWIWTCALLPLVLQMSSFQVIITCSIKGKKELLTVEIRRKWTVMNINY